MSTAWSVPMHRVYWLNSGDSIRVGDRKLTAVRPPCSITRLLSVSTMTNRKSFSLPIALVPSSRRRRRMPMMSERGSGSRHNELASGDNPWVHMVEPTVFNKALDGIRQMAPKMIFSAHLPPAQRKTEQLLELLARVLPPPLCCSHQMH